MPRRGDWPAAPIIYEIYPRSFFDTNGDGEGDLAGVTAKLGYVADLGVDAIWLAPFYLSPMHDGGYDVQDHTEVNPRFGTTADFDALVARAHALGLKVMIDQVFNHTSHRHAWFANSVARRGGYDDWYVWRDPKPDGTPPNNWLSQFGPPAWTWNHEREQYYFHQFLDCQPNLNLRHPPVLEALEGIARHWLDRGVDGFRYDAVTSYLWDESFADNPPSDPETRETIAGPRYNPYSMQDHEHDMLPGDGLPFAENLRRWAGEDAWLLGEITSGNKSVQLANGLTRPDRLDCAYTTDLPEEGMTPANIQRVADALETPRTFLWWLSCHDQPRPATAHGDGSERDARFLMTALCFLPGPWLIYQGEELGLPQPFLDYEENDDPFDRLYWPDVPGRQGPRVPIPWAEGYVGFGFTAATPWLTMRWDGGLSVLAQEADPDSVLSHVRRLTRFRRDSGIGAGRIASVKAAGDVLKVEIACEGASWSVRMNFADRGEAALDGDAARAEPAFASGEVAPGALPARTAAIWRRPD
ncbi:MAG: alpha-amylase family glycosyl hydrolase [Hasllibacter sp.]